MATHRMSFHSLKQSLIVFISCAITEFCVTSSLALDLTEGKNVVRVLAVSQTRQFELFLTNF